MTPDTTRNEFYANSTMPYLTGGKGSEKPENGGYTRSGLAGIPVHYFKEIV